MYLASLLFVSYNLSGKHKLHETELVHNKHLMNKQMLGSTNSAVHTSYRLRQTVYQQPRLTHKDIIYLFSQSFFFFFSLPVSPFFMQERKLSLRTQVIWRLGFISVFHSVSMANGLRAILSLF